MSSGKQVITGVSTLIVGVVLQTIIGLRFSGISESMIANTRNGEQLTEQVDRLLEKSHMEMLWMFTGMVVSYLLIAAGVVVVIWGIFLHFTRKERTSDINSPTPEA